MGLVEWSGSTCLHTATKRRWPKSRFVQVHRNVFVRFWGDGRAAHLGLGDTDERPPDESGCQEKILFASLGLTFWQLMRLTTHPHALGVRRVP